MILKFKYYICSFALCITAFFCTGCFINISNTTASQTEGPIKIVSPSEGSCFMMSNTRNKIVVRYDPTKIGYPMNRYFSTDEGATWISMMAEEIGDDAPNPEETRPQYYLLLWHPEANPNPPKENSKIWIKISGYNESSDKYDIVKNIEIK